MTRRWSYCCKRRSRPISPELLDILGPPLIVGLLIAISHALLGIEVLRRGIIFIDLAVAQIAGLGLLAAGLLHGPGWLDQAMAFTFALLAGGFFYMMEKRCPEQQEAIIGSSFVLGACLSILLLSDHPHGGEELQHLLSGQMLFITWQDLQISGPVFVLVTVAWLSLGQLRQQGIFYLLFALAITTAVQLVGVYLVFASLILPALAALNTSHTRLTACLCGVLSVSCGLVCAWLGDWPAGPVLVVMYCAWALILYFFADWLFAASSDRCSKC